MAAGPRDQESQVKPTEKDKVQDRPGQHQEERTPATEKDKEQDKKQQEPEDRSQQQVQADRPGGDRDDQKEKDKEEKDRDEERDRHDHDRERDDPEPGRDTTKQSGDDFSSPANNPYETNFEDPAQNRKTDPMTDHEPRHQGI